MPDAAELIQEHIIAGAKLRVEFFAVQTENLSRIALALSKTLAAGGKILSCGNGGSAADAQHFTGELVGRFLYERPSIPGITLSVDPSVMTAIGNDYGFEEVFARQVTGLGKPGDALVAISTSGNSLNVIRALEEARARGMLCIGLSGAGGGKMPALCDYFLDVPKAPTPLVQEIHGACIHLLCRLIDYYLFENALALQTDI